MKYALIDKKVTHQDIGGKVIQIEKEFTFDDILDTNFNEMPIAMYNFLMRRMDLSNKDGKLKVYYGHVGFLGYLVAEDEIEMVENE